MNPSRIEIATGIVDLGSETIVFYIEKKDGNIGGRIWGPASALSSPPQTVVGQVNRTLIPRRGATMCRSLRPRARDATVSSPLPTAWLVPGEKRCGIGSSLQH